jgi:excisionase family DNA binding protein
MKSRPTQFGMRELTASPRQHASRLAASSRLQPVCGEPQASATRTLSSLSDILDTARHSGTQYAATGERDADHLLTVRDVADLLQVPVSWVYGRTRKRSVERLPGIRLGKYWRFREEEIHSWVESQRGGHRVP